MTASLARRALRTHRVLALLSFSVVALLLLTAVVAFPAPIEASARLGEIAPSGPSIPTMSMTAASSRWIPDSEVLVPADGGFVDDAGTSGAETRRSDEINAVPAPDQDAVVAPSEVDTIRLAGEIVQLDPRDFDPAHRSASAEPMSQAISDSLAASPDEVFIEFNPLAILATIASGAVELPLPDGSTTTLPAGTTFEGIRGSTVYSATSGGDSFVLSGTRAGIAGDFIVDGVDYRLRPITATVHAVYIENEHHSELTGFIDDAEALGPETSGSTDRSNPTLQPPASAPVMRPDTTGTVTAPGTSIDELRAIASSLGTLRLAQGGAVTIDSLIWYDTLALSYHGSGASVEAMITLRINQLNDTLAAQGVPLSINLVELAYWPASGTGTGSGTNGDLRRITRHDDGFMDEVHARRLALSADLVTFVTYVDDVCGVAWLPGGPPEIRDGDFYSFNLVSAQCNNSGLSLAHEIGHNLGLDHDGAGSGIGWTPEARGYVNEFEGWRTMMSRNANTCCVRVARFSSTVPDSSGIIWGTPSADSVTALMDSRLTVASHFPDTCPDPVNDHFGFATVLASASVAQADGEIRCATGQFELEVSLSPPLTTVWYEWTAPASVPTRFTTCSPSTDFDTTIVVYLDAARIQDLDGDTAQFNDQDPACIYSPNHSTVEFTPIAGQTYKIQIDGWEQDVGRFSLLVNQAICNGAWPHLVARGVTPLTGTGLSEVLLGTSLDNIIDGSGGDDTVCGLEGNDVLFGGDGNDYVNGGSGNDEISGGPGADVLIGMSGTDRIEGDEGADIIDGGEGTDRLFGGDGNDTLLGGTGADKLRGDRGDDQILGGKGADNVKGGAGNDTLDGEDGTDTVRGGDGDDIVVGGDDIDHLYGDNGQDTLDGGGGSDRIRGGRDADTIHAGSGADRVWGYLGDDVIYGQGGQDILRGEGGADLLMGNHQSDELHGGSGDDIVNGHGGRDDVNGEAGDDTLRGHQNSDTLSGGSGTDRCDPGGAVSANGPITGCEL